MRLNSYLKIKKVTPHLGAEISGIDLTEPLQEEVAEVIQQALWQHGVLFFRNQNISIEQHKNFAKLFGKLVQRPKRVEQELEDPEVFVIRADEHYKPAGTYWHSDLACDLEPPMGGALHLHEVPESGGDTLFANMYSAYEALSGPMKSFLETFTAINSGAKIYAQIDPSHSQSEYPQSEHPVIRIHPVTKRKLLFVNPAYTTQIVGLTESESNALLQMLFEYTRRPEHQCRFRWQKHSLALWDNRCVQHYAVNDYWPQKRYGLRVSIQGDQPY